MTDILTSYGLFGTITLMFAAVGAISILVVLLVFFVKASNIKKLGMSGAEFYDDHPAHRRKSPRAKPAARRK